MNIYSRELKLFFRNKVSLFIYPFILLSTLLTFNKEVLDIRDFYYPLPYILSFIVPLLSLSIWQRERSLGIDGQLFLSKHSIIEITLKKMLAHLTYYGIVQLLFLPQISLLSMFGNVDFIKVISINIGVFTYLCLILSLTLIISISTVSRILSIVISVIINLIIIFRSDIFYTYYNGLIELSTLVYYGGLSLLFIIISTGLLERKASIKKITLLLLICISSIFLTLEIDGTTNREFSISKYTKEVANSNPHKFEISYFYSSGLIEKSPLVKRVIKLLLKFDKLKGVDVLLISDSNSAFNGAINKYTPYKDDGGNFSFIVISYNKTYHTIPTIPDSKTLEFEILKVFRFLIDGGLNRVGLYLGSDDFKEDSFSILKSKLSEDFFVEFLHPGDDIPEELNCLVIIGYSDINPYYTEKIGHYLSDGGNIIFSDAGLSIIENLSYKSSPVLESLISMGVYPEPYVIGESNSFDKYKLNVFTYPERGVGYNSILKPFTGFPGVYLSPVRVENNDFKSVLKTSSQTWLVNSPEGIDGQPESSFYVAALGESSISKYFTSHNSDMVNMVMVIGSSIALTDYPYSLGLEGSYDFIRRSIYYLNGDSRLIDVRNKVISENTYFKLDIPFKNSVLNLYIIFVILYSIIITIIIKKKAEK